MLLAEQSEMHFFPSQLKVGEGTQAHQKTKNILKKTTPLDICAYIATKHSGVISTTTKPSITSQE